MSEHGLSNERLVWMLTQMTRIREFEERVKGTFEEHPGVIRGHTHLADGAEASIVGALAAHGAGRPAPRDVPLPRLPDRARHRHEGDDGRDLRPEGRALRRATAARCTSPTWRAASSARRASSARASRTRPAPATRRRSAGKGQVVLSFFGDGASKQGAFHESLNIASLWKLPVVYVMENNNYNVVTRTEQEDANAAAGEPLAVKAKAFSMPGVTVDGGDPVAVYDVVSEAVERARSGGGPTLVESLVYRLSAHGNIIAPPGVPLHYPEHEAITVFGNKEEYEAALRGDPVPRFRARLVTERVVSSEQADAIAEAARAEMEAAVEFGLASPFPAAEEAVKYVYA